jgi:branched-chain amino acid transport system substrate-binding protein
MDEASNKATSSASTKSRRAFIRAGGAATVVGLTGCVQQQGGGNTTTEGDGGDDGSGDSGGSDTATTTSAPAVETVSVGVLSPVSGAFSPLGKAQRQAAKVAVDYVNNSDEFDFEMEAVYEDTQTSPSAGRQKAQKVVQEDGVDYIAGCANSSVSLAVADYCGNEGVPYASGGAAMDITGSNCNKYTFRNETNTAQQAAGLVNYAANELGSKWWIHTADYAYGNSAIEQIESRIDAEGHDVEIVGTTKPELGTSNFGPYVSQISNSDAEVLAVPLTGGDLINFLKQAASSGLKDEVNIIGTAIFAQTIRGALGEAAYGTYSSTLYNHKLETGDNRQFVEAYQSEYDGPPGSFARVGYEAVRMPARAVQEAGSTDADELVETLSGLEMTTVLGQASFRSCDHQSLNPVWSGEIVAPDSGKVADVKLKNKISGENATPACSEISCSL